MNNTKNETPGSLKRVVRRPTDHHARRRKRCRFGLRVKWIGGDWMMTACRFDPDTPEAAMEYGEMGLKDGTHIEAYQVVDRRSPNSSSTEKTQ